MRSDLIEQLLDLLERKCVGLVIGLRVSAVVIVSRVGEFSVEKRSRLDLALDGAKVDNTEIGSFSKKIGDMLVRRGREICWGSHGQERRRKSLLRLCLALSAM